MSRLSIVRAKAESHTLSVGPLRGTPVGRYSQDQLESAKQLVAVELKRLEHVADQDTLNRLERDLSVLEAELERREVDLGAA